MRTLAEVYFPPRSPISHSQEHTQGEVTPSRLRGLVDLNQPFWHWLENLSTGFRIAPFLAKLADPAGLVADDLNHLAAVSKQHELLSGSGDLTVCFGGLGADHPASELTATWWRDLCYGVKGRLLYRFYAEFFLRRELADGIVEVNSDAELISGVALTCFLARSGKTGLLRSPSRKLQERCEAVTKISTRIADASVLRPELTNEEDRLVESGDLDALARREQASVGAPATETPSTNGCDPLCQTWASRHGTLRYVRFEDRDAIVSSPPSDGLVWDVPSTLLDSADHRILDAASDYSRQRRGMLVLRLIGGELGYESANALGRAFVRMQRKLDREKVILCMAFHGENAADRRLPLSMCGIRNNDAARALGSIRETYASAFGPRFRKLNTHATLNLLVLLGSPEYLAAAALRDTGLQVRLLGSDLPGQTAVAKATKSAQLPRCLVHSEIPFPDPAAIIETYKCAVIGDGTAPVRFREPGEIAVVGKHSPGVEARWIHWELHALARDALEVLRSGNYSLLELSCWYHLKFELIHPFSDGNGRTGRAILVQAVARQLGQGPDELLQSLQARLPGYKAAMLLASRERTILPLLSVLAGLSKSNVEIVVNGKPPFRLTPFHIF